MDGARRPGRRLWDGIRRRGGLALGAGLSGLVLYSNASVLGDQLGVGPRLPVPLPALDLFNLFGVFGVYEANDFDAYVLGKTEATKDRQVPEWIELAPARFLPYRKADIRRQFAASRQALAGGEHRVRARGELAARIRAWHNRECPDQRVSQVQLGFRERPRLRATGPGGSPPPAVRYHVLFSEEVGH